MDLATLFAERFAFPQTSLLTPDEFRGELHKRHLRLGGIEPRIGQLECLHRQGILMPWATATANGDTEAAVSVKPGGWKRGQANTHWNFGQEWRYGWYQLLRFVELDNLGHRLESTGGGGRLGQGRWRLRPEGSIRRVVRYLDDNVLIALTAIESHYRPRIVGRLQLPSGTYETFKEFNGAFDPVAMAKRLEMSAEELRHAAEALAIRARSVDSMGRWSQVIDQAPSRWDELAGSALVALDHRIAAEMLFRLYEDLAKAGHAEPLPVPDEPSALSHRIRHGHPNLETLLTEFGLSTRPLAVIVVPGETEQDLLPLVAEALGYPLRPHVVDLRSAKGETTSLNTYIAKTVAFRIGRELRPGQNLVEARPTRVLVAMDPEGRYSTAKKRRDLKSKWVADVEREMASAGYRVTRTHLRQQIRLSVWHPRLPFEFAHFSDRDLAVGLMTIYPDKYEADRLEAAIQAERRASQPKIDRAAKCKVDKRKLAVALWPVMTNRLQTANASGNAASLPIARLVIDAYRYALPGSQYQYFSVPVRKPRGG